MSKPATLKQIAQALQLSIATVSRALKDHPDVSHETKKRVEELAGTLDYEPNAYAISLKTNNSKEFAIIVPEISNYFYNYFIAAVEEEARLLGYSVMILQSGNDITQEQENLRKCRKNRVSGLFVSTVGNFSQEGEYEKLENSNIPMIFFDKVPSFQSCNRVCVADEEAAILAAEAIIKKQKKNILAIFGDLNMSISRNRHRAFCETIDTGISQSQLSVVEAKSSETAYQELLKTYENLKPDVVFCMSDEILSGVMKAVQRLKLQIPVDIGIVAISNGFIPQFYYPEITYAETSGYNLGKLAFRRMLACMAGSVFKQTIFAQSALVQGGSL